MLSVYTFGGGDILYNIFQGIAIYFSKYGIVNSMISISTTVTLMWYLVRIFREQAIQAGVNYLVVSLVVANVFLMPTATVNINDLLTKNQRPVDNVPFLLAFLASLSSSVGHSITAIVEEIYPPEVEDLAYLSTGYVWGSRFLAQAGTFVIEDERFKDNMDQFMSQCVLIPAMRGRRFTSEELKNEPDLWKFIGERLSKTLRFPYKGPNHESSRTVACEDGYKLLNTDWNKEINHQVITLSRKQNPGVTATAAKSFFQKNSSSVIETFTSMGESAEKLIKQEMMINSIDSAVKAKLGKDGVGKDFSVAKALVNKRIEASFFYDLGARHLPALKTIFEALIYSGFLFFPFLALLPTGVSFVMNYVQMVIWVQLWPVFYAILNMIITLMAVSTTRTELILSKGITYKNSLGISGFNMDLEMTASSLVLSIPFLCLALMRGGVGSIMHLASSMLNTMQGASSQAANEMASGNSSLRNVNYNTSSFDNHSGNKFNDTAENVSGQFRRDMPDGTMITQTSDNTIFNSSGATSQLPFHISSDQSIRNELSNSLSQETALMRENAKEMSTLDNEALRNGYQFMQQASKGVHGNDSYSDQHGTGTTQMYQSVMRMSNQLESRFGMSSGQATDVALRAHLGFGVGGVDGSISTKTGRDFTDADLKNFTAEEGYQSQIEEFQKNIHDQSFMEQAGINDSLSKDLASSTERAHQVRESYSIHKQNVDRLSSTISQIDSKSFNIGYNEDQQFVNWAREKLGSDTAVYNLSKGGVASNEARALINEYQSHAAHEFVSNMMGSSPSLDNQYDFLQQDSRFGNANHNYDAQVHQEAANINLGLDLSIDDSVKQKTISQNSGIEAEMDIKRTNIQAERDQMQRQIDDNTRAGNLITGHFRELQGDGPDEATIKERVSKDTRFRKL